MVEPWGGYSDLYKSLKRKAYVFPNLMASVQVRYTIINTHIDQIRIQYSHNMLKINKLLTCTAIYSSIYYLDSTKY